MNLQTNDCNRPIIIRRKNIIKASGHHGGAWKVAYADFVTAMMAFFLLMWLLNATTEEQRKGISDYFNPSIPLAAVSGGGSDALNGDSIFAENTMARNGTGAAIKRTFPKQNTLPKGDKIDTADMDNLGQLATSMGNKNRYISDHIIVKMSPEGLVIELIDKEGDPLFPIGSSQPTLLMKQLMQLVADAFNEVDNQIKIVGHTDSRQFRGNHNYTNWELSSDRANMARRLLLKDHMSAAKIVEVSGKAATDNIMSNGRAAQNRRISIIILKRNE